ncbi:MAG TPA: hypothetical protein VF720_13345 [Candidatus Eisenbacteria bacterium]
MNVSSVAAALEPVSRFGGVLVFLIEFGIIAVLFRAMGIFRDEVRKVDSLVAEYVRCRDYLLSTRRPSVEEGWRTPDGGAFREAWGNFNNQLAIIRKRYRSSVRNAHVLLIVFVVLLVLAIIVWMLGLPPADGPLRIITPLAAAAAGLFLWAAALTALRAQNTLIKTRTDGNYLIAPWPTDGGTPDRQLALMDKFLPVDTDRPDIDPATEVV